MSDLTRGLTELDKARPGYEKAWRMYDGTAREVTAHDTIRPIIERSGELYRANFARKAVRARINRISVSALQVAGSDDNSPAPDSRKPDRQTQLLTDAVTEPNEFDIEIPRWIEMVCAYGDAYLLRWPAALEGEETTTAAEVDVFVHSPLHMRAIYDEENTRTIKFVIHAWSTGTGQEQRLRVNLYYDDRVERKISIEATQGEGSSTSAGWRDEMFQPYTEEHEDDEGVVTGDGPVITYADAGVDGMPIEHGRTARPYGRPVHFDAYGPQNAITKIMASHLSGLDWSTLPFRFTRSRPGTTGADLNDWDPDSREAPVKAGHSRTPPDKFSAKPGTMTKLHDTDEVGQLDGADPSVFLDPLVTYIKVLGETTDTPMNVIDRTGQVESGQSRTARIDDLLSDVANIQRQIAGPIASTCEGSLAMLGQAELTVTVTWAPSSKVTDAEGWQAVKAQQDAGVPIRTTLIEAGYLPEEVDAWASELDGKLTLIERLAEVMTMLGQAVTTMGLGQDAATELFAQLLGEVLGEDAPPIDLAPAPPEPPVTDLNADPADDSPPAV